jgi:hypothetical protein
MSTHISTLVRQEASLQLAENYGEAWTSADWDFLEGFKDEDNLVIATAMGRSLYAVTWAKTRLQDPHQGRPVTRRKAGVWTAEQVARAMAEL